MYLYVLGCTGMYQKGMYQVPTFCLKYVPDFILFSLSIHMKPAFVTHYHEASMCILGTYQYIPHETSMYLVHT